MLARAFADDPIFDLLVTDRADRTFEVQRLFERLDAPLASMGFVWEIGDAVAAAAWIPRGAHEAWAEIDAATLPYVREISPDGGRRWEAMWGWVLERIPDEPLWLLDNIGVEPGSQGTGLGRALIEHGFRLAEEDGVGTFLETTVPGNVPYYEHLGFHVVEDGVTPLEGPHAWLMRRDP
jgi:GNAT superfamily N-acetyltransferase